MEGEATDYTGSMWEPQCHNHLVGGFNPFEKYESQLG
jgi:hypothetical protein